jgi:hypothetical protein
MEKSAAAESTEWSSRCEKTELAESGKREKREERERRERRGIVPNFGFCNSVIEDICYIRSLLSIELVFLLIVCSG